MDTQARLRLYLILGLLLKTAISVGWSMSEAGLNDSSYNVRHLSTHFARVFLSVSVEHNDFPTLIEAQWPVSYLPMRTAIYPNSEVHASRGQLESDCTRLQQAHWSQVDSLSRLWVMDVGWPNSECPPKLFVFDLIRNNAELLRIDCGQHIDSNASESLVVHLGPKASNCELERYIFFISDRQPHIVAYDILEQTWHRRELKSNKYENMSQTFPIKPIDFTFGLQGELLVSDQDGVLYSSTKRLQLEGSITDSNSNSNSLHIQLTRLGNLLGPSRSMIVDYFGALFYVMPKFGAVVRCAQLTNLTAEGNEIIYLTSKNIQQIFFGIEGSVWVLSDRVLKPQDICYPGILN
ncbi:uncharacterized protein LOC6582025 [Drosophila mojavensis]|uniref:Bee-milk protein n=1 Tax=Drosophila mojavensis TaxID=7230 RepID=B4KUI6_DROMO|nr:uncharacterized protein LOC6582025 [Drosophila mojavensis]EDW18214.1 uncharacterized protein Dmoj_GI13116 [Drosophila mojavensis]